MLGVARMRRSVNSPRATIRTTSCPIKRLGNAAARWLDTVLPHIMGDALHEQRTGNVVSKMHIQVF